MNLTEKNQENVNHMIAQIKKKLGLVNEHMIRAENYSTAQYDELLEIYDMVKNKSSISVMEKEAILSELGNLRSESPEG